MICLLTNPIILNDFGKFATSDIIDTSYILKLIEILLP